MTTSVVVIPSLTPSNFTETCCPVVTLSHCLQNLQQCRYPTSKRYRKGDRAREGDNYVIVTVRSTAATLDPRRTRAGQGDVEVTSRAVRLARYGDR